MNFKYLDDFMNNLDDYGVPDAAIQVFFKDVSVYKKSIGHVGNSTLFRMFSLTKPVTIVAALTLLEQGKYLLTDNVSDYIPQYAHMKVMKAKPNGGYDWCSMPAEKNIRIIDLMTMTAGLTYDGVSTPSEKAVTEAFNTLYTNTNGSMTTMDFAKMLADVPLQFEPSTHWLYSFCLDVLGALIEVWSGMKFSEYCKKYIFEPLKMTDCYFRVTDEIKDRLCPVKLENEPDENDIFFRNYENFESGGAGLICSLDDYVKFARMLTNKGTLDHVKILGSKTIDLMRSNFLSADALSDYHEWPQLEGYGYGLGVRTLISPERAGLSGTPGEFGWSGLAGTYLLADPDNEITIVYAQQMIPNKETEIHRRIRNIVYGCLL